MNTTAEIIRQQITPGVLMSLGAHKVESYIDQQGQVSLIFMASVLPFTIDGIRSTRPREMHVVVTLEGDDTYTIQVVYTRQVYRILHFFASRVYADELALELVLIDSDGDLNTAPIGHINREL